MKKEHSLCDLLFYINCRIVTTSQIDRNDIEKQNHSLTSEEKQKKERNKKKDSGKQNKIETRLEIRRERESLRSNQVIITIVDVVFDIRHYTLFWLYEWRVKKKEEDDETS